MARKEAPAWTIDLAGETHTLVPSAAAFIGIEQTTGKTIRQHLAAVEDGPLPLRDLAVISLALIGAGLPTGRSPIATDYAMLRLGVAEFSGSHLDEAVLAAGVMPVTAAVMPPLSAALLGKVNGDGSLKTEKA